MRLFLSSENLGRYPEVFLKMVGDKKLAIIHNAIDDWDSSDKQNKVQQHLDQLSGQGFDAEDIDLRAYFNKQEKLLDLLSNFGGIFVFGGNTFILRRAMASSGFDKIIKKLLKAGLTYGGSSAGSCVVAHNLHGIDIGDRPESAVVPDEYPIKETIWEGLGLVDFMVVPHVGSDWWGKEADKAVKYLKKHELPYKSLKDGQVIVIDGNKEEFLK